MSTVCTIDHTREVSRQEQTNGLHREERKTEKMWMASSMASHPPKQEKNLYHSNGIIMKVEHRARLF
jgi:hypothetical protein